MILLRYITLWNEFKTPLRTVKFHIITFKQLHTFGLINFSQKKKLKIKPNCTLKQAQTCLIEKINDSIFEIN